MLEKVECGELGRSQLKILGSCLALTLAYLVRLMVTLRKIIKTCYWYSPYRTDCNLTTWAYYQQDVILLMQLGGCDVKFI